MLLLVNGLFSFLLSQYWPTIFFPFLLAKAAMKEQRSDIMCRTPVLIGGNAVRVRIRRLAAEPPRSGPGLMPFNLALDPDLGPDPDRGSAVSAGPDSV